MFESSNWEGSPQTLWNRFLSIFNKGKDEVVKSSKVSKARLDLSSLKKERERVFERLGEEVYKRNKDKAISVSGLDALFAEINIINLKVSSKERELKDLKGEEANLIRSEQKVIPIRREKREGHQRPRRKPSEAKQDVSGAESRTNNMGL